LLKNTVIKSPEESGYKQAVWDGKLICRFLEEKRDIQISVRTSQNWLKKINFTRQKPRKKYEKGNIEEIEAFKKKVEEETLQLNENELIIFSDEAGINLDADLSKIWSPKGEQPEILTHSPFGRVNLTGFVCPARGELIINQILKGNSENFIKQLEMVSELYKNYKIKIYVDNAKWHKSKMVMNWLTSNDIITLDYLPKYAPNANPMERHWWYLTRIIQKDLEKRL
jgi:transposase